MVSISAFSEKQAMDWSLVLASQAIETTIIVDPERQRWGLLVTPEDYPRALQSIRLYRLENRDWQWHSEIPWAGITFHFGGVLFAVGLAILHLLATEMWPGLNYYGRLDSVQVRNGEWWRLFTAVSLHSDLAHLGLNMAVGAVLAGLAMARYGPGIGLLMAFLGGAVGNAFGLLAYSKPYIGLGASGMIMGFLGMLAVHAAAGFLGHKGERRQSFIVLISACFLFVLVGTSHSSDVVAHLGGFLAGTLVGLPFAWRLHMWQASRFWNSLAWTAFLGLWLLTWGLALRH